MNAVTLTTYGVIRCEPLPHRLAAALEVFDRVNQRLGDTCPGCRPKPYRLSIEWCQGTSDAMRIMRAANVAVDGDRALAMTLQEIKRERKEERHDEP